VLNFDEFLAGMQLDLTPNRKILVDKAFKKLDVNG
jgi:hypothetical protein